ncbi:MAG: recombination mediator RecR [Spirochaetota bacterium]|nr:recombination mediator RecR [Spirochaetota bacterium]
MNYYTSSMEKVVREFSKFPGIGTKSAEKLAFYVLKRSNKDVEDLCQALLSLKQNTKFCKVCFHLTEDDICSICKDLHRNKKVICVVEQFKDVISIEKTLEYKGLYHVLMGHLSPLEGIGPDDIKITELIKRVKQDKIEELILATNPNVEGDATSLYILEILKNHPIRITRIARGLPVGGDLEFADLITLSSSIAKREELKP